ncbi:MAG: histidine kinase [Melioribacteraceae bacterium]|nr:histidine kinase [Melioribacteraceae bacterium]
MKLQKISHYFNSKMSYPNHPSFKVVNIIGWVVLILVDSFIVSPEITLVSAREFISNALQWSSGYFVTSYVRKVYKYYPYKKKNLIQFLVYILIISFLASILLYFIAHFIYILFAFNEAKVILKSVYNISYLTRQLTRFFPLMTSWSLLYFGIKFWLDLIYERERAQKSELLAKTAHLKMLQYQVNPHFLFNSFCSLRALIRIDQSKAEDFVGRLSDYYRYTLLGRENNTVELIDEITAIKNYAEIEKVRFDEKIIFTFDIKENSKSCKIPGFIIHPLIENAIKYGMKSNNIPLEIFVSTRFENEKLFVDVENNGDWSEYDSSSKNGTGTGMKNIKSRLEFYYPAHHSLEIIKEENRIKIRIIIWGDLL